MNPFTTPPPASWTPPPPNPLDEIAKGRTALAVEVAAGRVKIEVWGASGGGGFDGDIEDLAGPDYVVEGDE